MDKTKTTVCRQYFKQDSITSKFNSTVKGAGVSVRQCSREPDCRLCPVSWQSFSLLLLLFGTNQMTIKHIVTSVVHVIVLYRSDTASAWRWIKAGTRRRVMNEHTRYWTSDWRGCSRSSGIPAGSHYHVGIAATWSCNGLITTPSYDLSVTAVTSSKWIISEIVK